jgi:hypothetical protein
MYFVLSSALLSWRNHIAQAVPLGDTVDHQSKPIHWWECVPLPHATSRFIFEINPKAPHLDNYFTGTIMDLYAERLIDLLGQSDIAFETFPAILLDKKTDEILPLKYQVFHLLDSYSIKGLRARDEEGKVISVLAPKRMFRLTEYRNLVIVHQEVKDTLEAAQMTGCNFRPFK